mgnify:CR=1 FL=1
MVCSKTDLRSFIIFRRIIQINYEIILFLENLLKLAVERHAALEDAIRLYAFYGDCDDLERWIRDKEKLLKTEDPSDTVDSAKRKYEVIMIFTFSCNLWLAKNI